MAFDSLADNLVPGDTNGALDIFVRDRKAGVTERVSISSGEAQANDHSSNPSISADERFVAFESAATNLVAGDTNAVTDIFVRDRKSGTTERVSVTSSEIQATGGDSSAPSISADGRFVAFWSLATNLVAGDTNARGDVFVRDRQNGTTQRVSVTSAGIQATGGSVDPTISPDGRFVAFHSDATNLVANDTNGHVDVFVHDRQTGQTDRVSISGGEAQANGDSFGSSISTDGRFVAFHSGATNLVSGDSNGQFDVFVRDRLAGVTQRVSVTSAGAQAIGGLSLRPSISADGRFVAFYSDAANLVAGDTNGFNDIFVHDRRTGTTERVSVAGNGAQATGGSSIYPSISAVGRFVAFQSIATDLVPGDTNATTDIFVRDQGLLPDGNNDLVADYGGLGTWERLNEMGWQKIHGGSPAMVTSGDLNGSLKDEAIMSFSGSGLWARYDNAIWVKLHNATPNRFVAGDFDGNGEDDLVADFGSPGIWVKRNNGGFAKLHNSTSQDLSVGDLDGNGKDELIADFGGAGLWVRYNDSNWVKRHDDSPVHIATGDLDGSGRDELIADFGPAGIWAFYNDNTWVKLHNSTSQGLAAGDLDGNDQEDLIVDFGAAGLWVRYNDATWVKRHNTSPQGLLATDLDGNGQSDIVADFGASGLWARYNDAAWSLLTFASPQVFAAGGFD